VGEFGCAKEINDFCDELNGIGAGYDFGRDFVLKGCLYLTPPLPIQYMVKISRGAIC